MNRKEIQEIFSRVKENSSYIRVNEEHPLELYLGLNDKGNLTLRYNGNFEPAKLHGGAILQIKQVHTQNYNSILFSFNSEENLSLFYNFCEDIINQTQEYKGKNGYIEIINRYNQWRKMFYGTNKLLDEAQIKGLLGELLFLKDFALPMFGETDGLKGWTGPEPTHKDFSYTREWYEIKAKNNSKNTVTISSIEQLDSEYDGWLVIYSFEKMSPSFDGLKLNDLVSNIFKALTLENNKDIFIEKLNQAGYSFNEEYDNYVYNFISCDKYFVDENFPRIKAKDISSAISGIKYDLFLPQIECFKE